MNTRFNNKNTLWIFSSAIFMISIGLEWYGRKCGYILISDSLQYLSAARSFVEDGSFRSPDGSFYSYWPPLFPILLSLFSDDPLFGASLINFVCKAITTITLGYISYHLIHDTILRLLFLGISILSVQMIMISVFLLSELLFIALILLNTYSTMRLHQRPRFFLWILITGFLMCIQRNAGLFWIVGVCIWLLLDSSINWKTRIIRSVLCFIISTSGFWAWNIYNTFFLPAEFSFYEGGFFHYVIPNLSLVLSNLGMMLIYGNEVISICTGFLFIILTLYMSKRWWRENRALQFLFITTGAYVAGYISMPGRLDVYELDRYFSVLVPIVYLFLTILILEVLKRVARKWVIYLMMFFWASYPIMRTLKNIEAWHERSCIENSHAVHP